MENSISGTKYLYSKDLELGFSLSSIQRRREVRENLSNIPDYLIEADEELPSLSYAVKEITFYGVVASLLALFCVYGTIRWLVELFQGEIVIGICWTFGGIFCFGFCSLAAYTFLPTAIFLRKYPNTYYSMEKLLSSKIFINGLIVEVLPTNNASVISYAFENLDGETIYGKYQTKKKVDLMKDDIVKIWYASDTINVLM